MQQATAGYSYIASHPSPLKTIALFLSSIQFIYTYPTYIPDLIQALKMGRSCEKDVLKRGPWTEEEDQKLIAYIQQHSYGSGWTALAKKAGLNRCGKSCRLRWINYLRPGIKRGKFSLQEEQTIIQLHAFLGNRWSAIAAYLPKRTDNEIKNHWNTHLKKRLIKMGVDPMTHKPARIDANGSSSSTHGSNDANLICHMAQWERARLEAEARAARGSNIAKQTLFPNHVQPKSQLRSRTPAVPLPLASKPKCLDILQAWQGIVSDVINFPSHHYLESSSSMSSQSQVPTAGINQNAAAATNLYTCDELDGLDSWDRVDKFNHQMQELENVMDESTPILAMEGTSTYSTKDGWFMDNTFQQGNDDGDDLVANFMEDSWETLIGIPVSFSPMEVEISNGMGL